jgi:transcription elongation factor Elf1
MSRHAKYRHRGKDFYQDSPLLNLPGEIRTLIYHAALVRLEPIDLWPRKYIEHPEDVPSLASRLAKAQEKSQYGLDTRSSFIFRQQEDLQHVRKEMAIGLVATCKQIQQEAGHLFWSENTFRFSSDLKWYGLRRFLSAIGPRPISLLRNLQVFAPFHNFACLTSVPRESINFEDLTDAKNEPKMRMGKARRKKDDRYFDLDALARNVEYICFLLDEARVCADLHFILPNGFAANQQDEICIPESLKIGPRFSSMTLIVEAGAALNGPGFPEMLLQSEIIVVCRPGSIWRLTRDADYEESKLTEEKRWSNPVSQLDYLIGIETLLQPPPAFEVVTPALGGRTTKEPGRRRKALRTLKGFGGCSFVHRKGWDCTSCGKTIVSVKTNEKVPYTPFLCSNCGTSLRLEERIIVEPKKVTRALRQGLVEENRFYEHRRDYSSSRGRS